MKHIYLLILAVFLSVLAPKAYASGLFTINNIEASGKGNSAKEAKDNATATAHTQAFQQLLGKIVSDTPQDKWPTPTPEEISDLVQSFDVINEKVTQKTYKATLNISFNKELVEKLLQVNNIKYISKTSEPVVVLPLFNDGTNNLLWEDSNIWAAAWKKAIASSNYTKFVLPKNEKAITTEKLISAGYPKQESDQQIVQAIANKYLAKKLLLAKATRSNIKGKPAITVEIVDLNNAASEKNTLNFEAKSDSDTIETVMQNAVLEIIGSTENKWKQTQNATEAATSRVNVLVQISSLNEWNQVKSRLSNLDFIQSLAVKSVSSSQASVDINFQGDYLQLVANLQKNGITLEEHEGVKILYISGNSGWSSPPQNSNEGINEDNF
jgi:hypothetical protein